MAHAVKMDGTDIDLKIPLSELASLVKTFYQVCVTDEDNNREVGLYIAWEEDGGGLIGYLVDDVIVFNRKQSGTFKNSLDGGLGDLLEKYNGSGTLELVGEDGEVDHIKYVDGKGKEGKVVYE